MTISAPPLPPHTGDPVDRAELEAIVEALIEEARRRARRRRRIYGAATALVALVGVALFAIFERNGAAQSQASSEPAARSGVPAGSTTSKIAFVVKASGVGGDAVGRFTLVGAVPDSGPSQIIGNTSSAQALLGERVYKGRGQGPGDLHGRQGDLSFWWTGSFVSVNAATVVTTGVWRIRRGTGIYKTWKGGGTFVDVGHHAPSVDNRTPSAVGTDEARFEGRVRR